MGHGPCSRSFVGLHNNQLKLNFVSGEIISEGFRTLQSIYDKHSWPSVAGKSKY